MEIEKGDEETILCFCISEVKDRVVRFRWYEIDLSSHTKDKKKKKKKNKQKKKKKNKKKEEEKLKSPLLLSEFPADDHHFDFGCVGIDSKVYLIGGTLMSARDEVIRALSSSVHFIDTRIPGSYQEGTRMIGGKAGPLTHAVDGKIYAFGRPIASIVPSPDTLAQPWAEFFDPTAPNFWCALPDPSDEVIIASSFSGGNLVFYEKANKFLIGYGGGLSGGILFFFNLTTKSYEYGLERIPITKQFLFSGGKHAVIGHTLYMFYPPEKCLYSYDLSMRNNLQSIPIIDALSPPALLSLPDHHICPPYLFHLGNHKLCLVWFSWNYPGGFQIHYFIFHVEEGLLVAHNPLDPPYCLDDAEPIRFHNCLLIKRRPLGTAAAPDSVDPGVQQTMPRTQETSQDTRLGCRVHVSGIPSSTNEEAIQAFFNKLIKNCDSESLFAGAVVNVYFNNVKRFAIIEFSCEEEANNAVKRACVPFEGEELKICRPGDYKCQMIWQGWASEKYRRREDL